MLLFVLIDSEGLMPKFVEKKRKKLSQNFERASFSIIEDADVARGEACKRDS
jgi:hypothetical protein